MAGGILLFAHSYYQFDDYEAVLPLGRFWNTRSDRHVLCRRPHGCTMRLLSIKRAASVFSVGSCNPKRSCTKGNPLVRLKPANAEIGISTVWRPCFPDLLIQCDDPNKRARARKRKEIQMLPALCSPWIGRGDSLREDSAFSRFRDGRLQEAMAPAPAKVARVWTS